MGTTNRSYNRHSRRAAFSNTVIKSRRQMNKRDTKRVEKEKAIKSSRSFFEHIGFAVRGFLGIFGFGRESAIIHKAYKPVTFSTPTHSDHDCGRRSFAEVDRRKKRRQKRTRLIQTRGWA